MATQQAKILAPPEHSAQTRAAAGAGRRGKKATAGTSGPVSLAVVSGPSEVWQARVTHDLSAELVEDMTVLGLESKTDAVRAALVLLHRHAAELRMAESVGNYYGGNKPPLPTGVVPFDPSEIEDDEE